MARRMAFETDRDGNGEVYVMNSDGTQPLNLTGSPGNDSHPAWSPDGRSIAFDTERYGKLEVAVMDADGSNVRRLTNIGALSVRPSWSPDGRTLAFESNDGGDFDLYLIGADGSGQVKLLALPGNQRSPVWSTNGDAILFRSDHNSSDGSYEVYMAEPDGSNLFRVTRNPADDTGAAWSPLLPSRLGVVSNGAVAFSSNYGGNQDIYLTNADGSVQAQLTDHLASDREPSWSPDGTRLAFTSNRDGGWELYTIGSNGVDLTRLTRKRRPGGDAAMVSGRSEDRLLDLQEWERRHLHNECRRLQCGEPDRLLRLELQPLLVS